MYDHLLVPLDGSTFAEAALPHAVTLAQQTHGEITLLRVVLPPRVGDDALSPESADFLIRLRDDLYNEAISYLQGLQQSLERAELDVHYRVAEAEDVAAEIIAAAREIGADTVVMCTHGRGGLSRWLFGSVATRVLQSSSLPVLVIRPKDLKE